MSPARRRLAPAAPAALGGALYFLGYLGWGLWPLVFVFLVPLWSALERARGARGATGLGLLFGAVAYAGGYTWLWPLVEVFLDGRPLLGAALWTLHGLWFASGFALYGWLFHVLRRRRAPVALAGVAPLLLVEWLQPQLFPVHAGAALADVVPLVQIADLGGPLLLSAFVGLANAAAHAVWTAWRDGRRVAWAACGAGALLALAVLGYGALRMAGVDAAQQGAPTLRVGLVQANLGVLEKRTRAAQGHRLHLAQTRELLAQGPLDLVVWPETAYTRGLRRPLPVDGQPVRGELPVPLLFGGSSVWEQDGRRVSANSALLVGSDGAIRDAYDKNLLIPLAERVPLQGWLPGLSTWFPHLQSFRAARDTPALRLGEVRIATPICYEAIVAPFVRRMVREARPQLLVTLANDAWFGDSAEPWMHLSLARLRAVEHRLWLVRATNSGISAVVDPAGRIVARTALGARESLRAEVRTREPAATLYARAGDWPGPLSLAAVALACFRRPSRGRAGAGLSPRTSRSR